jgi:DNA-binding NarL/FixJ family response regulator
MKVLLVDDSRTVRKLLRRVLSNAPGVVVAGEATSGEEALASAADLRPDVVIMDWHMPGMNGAQATAALREMHPEARVVGFTSSRDAGIHHALLDAGAAAVFAKEDAIGLKDYVVRLATVD